MPKLVKQELRPTDVCLEFPSWCAYIASVKDDIEYELLGVEKSIIRVSIEYFTSIVASFDFINFQKGLERWHEAWVLGHVGRKDALNHAFTEYLLFFFR